MSIVRQRLETALALFHQDDDGALYLSGAFVELCAELHVRNIILAEGNASSIHRAKMARVLSHLLHVQQDLWNALTITYRVWWQKELWHHKKLPNELWMQFAAADIDLFHIVLRSILDDLAEVVRLISDEPGQVKQRSFQKLREWAKRSDSNARRLGADLATVILACEWFDDLRGVRDSVVHKGGFTLVFPTEGKVLFQVYEGINSRVLKPEIMFNRNVVDFERYAGLYAAYLEPVP